MNIDYQYKYKILMSNRLVLPMHFQKRYKQRVSKSSEKAQTTVKKAYLLGKGVDSIEDKRLRQYLEEKANNRGSVCKIYKGFVYWFDSHKAITVYPISGIKTRRIND